jgi:hypothetical protein
MPEATCLEEEGEVLCCGALYRLIILSNDGTGMFSTAISAVVI